MKERYWLYLIVLLALLGGGGKLMYDSYRQHQLESEMAQYEKDKINAVSKELAARRLHAKKRPIIPELPYCVNYAVSDVNALTEESLKAFIQNCAYNLIKTKDYEKFDSTISDLRDKQLRSPSGLWLQSFFYQGAKRYLEGAKSEQEMGRVESELNDWIRRYEKSDAARLLLCDLIISRAWLNRGDGFASAVPKENFAKFHAGISQAKKYLLENKDISSRDPKWYSLMLSVITYEENTSAANHKNYFDEAVKLYPDYYPIYNAAATFYYSKWHGNGEVFDRFAVYANAKQSDTQAKTIYARMYWNSVCSECGNDGERNWVEHWKQISEGMDQIVTDYPDMHNFNSYAWMACSAGDMNTLTKMLGTIKSSVDFSVWVEPFSYRYCSQVARASVVH
ncbi:MAG: hypothetical protein ACREO1_05260 [Arenimonas sp.]